MSTKGKCRPRPNNTFYRCGSCCAEIKCNDKSCPWVLACKGKDFTKCEDYVSNERKEPEE